MRPRPPMSATGDWKAGGAGLVARPEADRGDKRISLPQEALLREPSAYEAHRFISVLEPAHAGFVYPGERVSPSASGLRSRRRSCRCSGSAQSARWPGSWPAGCTANGAPCACWRWISSSSISAVSRAACTPTSAEPRIWATKASATSV